MTQVAVLFARENSNYFKYPDLDIYPASRDARTYNGNLPVICHPPCRMWGRLAHWAKYSQEEKDLALFAVDQVRKCGGVLEHPAYSKLWDTEKLLPLPGQKDDFGGFTLPVWQGYFGHRAPKDTWLYIVGVNPKKLPLIPLSLGLPDGRIEKMGKSERESTPTDFCEFLIKIAKAANLT